MQYGFSPPVSGPLSSPDNLARIASEGEAIGYDYATISDHVVIPRDIEAKYPYSDTGEFPARARALPMRSALHRAFALRDELRTLAQPETIVCRCEDVPLDRMRAHPGWRAAKLQTRCGMGPCQGRICGPAAEFLLGWKQESVRPPILPVRLDHFTR